MAKRGKQLQTEVAAAGMRRQQQQTHVRTLAPLVHYHPNAPAFPSPRMHTSIAATSHAHTFAAAILQTNSVATNPRTHQRYCNLLKLHQRCRNLTTRTSDPPCTHTSSPALPQLHAHISAAVASHAHQHCRHITRTPAQKPPWTHTSIVTTSCAHQHGSNCARTPALLPPCRHTSTATTVHAHQYCSHLACAPALQDL